MPGKFEAQFPWAQSFHVGEAILGQAGNIKINTVPPWPYKPALSHRGLESSSSHQQPPLG
jgi:hypothetical protein